MEQEDWKFRASELKHTLDSLARHDWKVKTGGKGLGVRLRKTVTVPHVPFSRFNARNNVSPPLPDTCTHMYTLVCAHTEHHPAVRRAEGQQKAHWVCIQDKKEIKEKQDLFFTVKRRLYIENKFSKKINVNTKETRAGKVGVTFCCLSYNHPRRKP